MKLDRLFTIIKVLALVGILLSLYLLFEQLVKPSYRPCTINAVVNCDAVIDGPVAKTLGIPTPLFGLVGYICIFAFALAKKIKDVQRMSTFGLAFCLYIAYVELILLHVVCPVCIMCQVTMIAIFTLSIYMIRR